MALVIGHYHGDIYSGRIRFEEHYKKRIRFSVQIPHETSGQGSGKSPSPSWQFGLKYSEMSS